MIKENRQFVTNEPVEFEKKPVEAQDYRKFTGHFNRRIYRIYPDLKKENLRLSTCNRLDLQTLGSQLIMMPKNLHDHCSGTISKLGWSRQLTHNQSRGSFMTQKGRLNFLDRKAYYFLFTKKTQIRHPKPHNPSCPKYTKEMCVRDT